MNDPSILFVRPGSIKSADKTALRKVGVVVIEIDDPSSVKFTRAQAEVTSTEMLGIAMKVIIDKGEFSRFGQLVAMLLADRQKALATKSPA